MIVVHWLLTVLIVAVPAAAKPPEPAHTAPQRPPVSPERPRVQISRGAPRTTLRWDRLRQCESHGNYGTDTGNGFHGAYQAAQGTWNGVWKRHARPDLIGTNPARSSREDQDEFARLLYSESGARPWPICGRLL